MGSVNAWLTTLASLIGRAPGLLEVDDVAACSAPAGMQNAHLTGSAIWPDDPARTRIAGENNRPSIVPNLSSPLPAPRVARHPGNGGRSGLFCDRGADVQNLFEEQDWTIHKINGVNRTGAALNAADPICFRRATLG